MRIMKKEDFMMSKILKKKCFKNIKESSIKKNFINIYKDNMKKIKADKFYFFF